MKKGFKFIVWLAGLAIFLLLTAHLTLKHSLNTPKFKTALTGFIERSTGRHADYQSIDYSLFPFSLVVQEARLKEKDDTQDFASIQSFTAVVDFRTKEISALRLEKPSIRIVQQADGSFNFSDLISAPPSEAGPAKVSPSASPGETAPSSPAPAAPAPAAPAPTFAIRMVDIEDAHFEFVRMDAENHAETFTLSNLCLQVHNFSPDQPFQLDGHVTIGKTSVFQFEGSGPALAAHAGNPGTWPIVFASRLDIRDFADLRAFLPEGTLPFQSLGMALHIQGALADHLTVSLNLQTPEATEAHPVELDLGLRAEVSLPGPVAQYLFAGTPLPESLQFSPPACEPPPGTMALTEDPLTALLVHHLRATGELTFPKIAYGQNRFEQGTATFQLRQGVLSISDAKLAAYGGTIEGRGNVQLLACPLTYRLDRLVADHLAVEQALAANGLGDFAEISGTLHLEASVAGQAVGEPALRSLEANAQARIDHLQSVGTGGSLMDQVWLQLDNPLLLNLVPRLKPKVEQAQAAATHSTTSHYDEATATLALRNGTATLSDTRLSMPGYRLQLAGTILPFADRLDLSARLVASPEETARLTDGKDRSAYLPYEDGGLMIPLTLQGSLTKPAVLPDLNRLLQNALAGTAGESLAPHLENLSDSDKKHVQEGLQLLQGFGALFQKP